MKKIIILFACAFIMINAKSQVATPTKKEAQKDMRSDVKDLKAERKDRNKKIVKAKFHQANVEQKEIKADRKDLNANKKHLKNKGVKVPVKKAKEQVDGAKSN